jgi:hypothetical protein
MKLRQESGAVFALALVAAHLGFSGSGRAEPTINAGIGLSNCAKLGADLKPADGLNHMPNALLYFWIQGYLSAANIYLLNDSTNHIDMSAVEAGKMIKLVADFCAANPDNKPVTMIDKFIKDADKVDVKESQVPTPWDD